MYRLRHTQDERLHVCHSSLGFYKYKICSLQDQLTTRTHLKRKRNKFNVLRTWSFTLFDWLVIFISRRYIDTTWKHCISRIPKHYALMLLLHFGQSKIRHFSIIEHRMFMCGFLTESFFACVRLVKMLHNPYVESKYSLDFRVPKPVILPLKTNV